MMGDAREMLAIHRKSRDLISIGAYRPDPIRRLTVPFSCMIR